MSHLGPVPMRHWVPQGVRYWLGCHSHCCRHLPFLGYLPKEIETPGDRGLPASSGTNNVWYLDGYVDTHVMDRLKGQIGKDTLVKGLWLSFKDLLITL